MKRLSAALLFVVACAGSQTPGEDKVPTIPQAKSALERQTPAAAPADLSTLTADNSRFAQKLHAKLVKPNENLVFSPHSISIALAMTYAGAKGTTKTEMATALELKLPDTQLHDAFNALDLSLESRNHSGDKHVELSVANSVFVEKTSQWNAAYLDTLALNYGAGLQQVDFIKNAEPARLLINDWVSAKTKAKILDLLTPGALDSDTRLVLVNAIYLNASWAASFAKVNTQDGTFTNENGSTTTVPFMRGSDTAQRHAATADADYVELPYSKGALQMIIALPKAGKLAAVEADPLWLKSGMDALQAKEITLSLPKIEIKPDGVSLKTALQTLGMQTAFTDAADFSGMTDADTLKIDDVIHKAFIKLDESGTEAAAATAVTTKTTSAPIDAPIEVKVDRPFLFAIVDDSGAILFQGRVGKL